MASRYRSTIWVVGMAGLAAILLWLATAVPGPVGSIFATILDRAGPPGLALAAVLVLATVAAIALGARRPLDLPVVKDEEPLLTPPRVPACQRRSPTIAIIGLEPGAGSSSLAFNLAVLIATEGLVAAGAQPRRPRPVCLLEQGPLAAALGLSPAPLTEYLADHPAHFGDEVIDLVMRHASGCELLSIGEDVLGGHQLRLLLPVLARHYDSVLIDCPPRDHWLTDVALELSDVAVLVALPSPASVPAAEGWATRIWDLGHEHKTVLLTNRCRARVRPPRDLTAGFNFAVELPEDAIVTSSDRTGLPWSLNGRSPAAACLVRMARELVPRLFSGGVWRAA